MVGECNIVLQRTQRFKIFPKEGMLLRIRDKSNLKFMAYSYINQMRYKKVNQVLLEFGYGYITHSLVNLYINTCIHTFKYLNPLDRGSIKQNTPIKK